MRSTIASSRSVFAGRSSKVFGDMYQARKSGTGKRSPLLVQWMFENGII